MKDKDIAKVTRGLVQIPMVGGTIAFGYNYDCDLKLTQEQAVRVAMGMVKNWKELGCKSGKLLGRIVLTDQVQLKLSQTLWKRFHQHGL